MVLCVFSVCLCVIPKWIIFHAVRRKIPHSATLHSEWLCDVKKKKGQTRRQLLLSFCEYLLPPPLSRPLSKHLRVISTVGRNLFLFDDCGMKYNSLWYYYSCTAHQKKDRPSPSSLCIVLNHDFRYFTSFSTWIFKMIKILCETPCFLCGSLCNYFYYTELHGEDTEDTEFF